MRIAIIGSGISGLSAAWLLSRQHEVVLYEAGDYLGGHTDTHEVDVDGRTLHVDTGFIVHNPQHYPLLTRLFDQLGVASQPTTMGFSVQDERTGLEYNATSLDGLFCQRRNLASPRFLGMLADLVRFYREAPALLEVLDTGPSLGDYLQDNRYGDAFRDQHLLPMASALWSSPADQILRFPAKYLVRFMANHHMLQLTGRPEWRVVRGGSRRYVEAMSANWNVQVRLSSPVRGVMRDEHGASVRCDTGTERFDQVVMACHSDQALALLEDAGDVEHEILGAIAYQSNDTVLHTDARLLPRHRKAWAAWNAYLPADPARACTVSYCMNLLQDLPGDTPLVVSLNRTQDIDPARILARRAYHHPVYTHAAVAAQARRHEIQGVRRTWFAGAYWGWGFHEDGIRSGVDVARGLGVAWPATNAAEALPTRHHATSVPA
ncbi:FAD-dependent oxidoreductase [Thermomonas sp. HDW16]|uniref:NAD(P)/FAD-dependent oxidoreductase n=1 Tax=Thermomonas sp. HDW16 TaxID=2714945 RepID=UPI00140C02D0|nr:FAD-dependent oxidoreductase [Thermomonas sp. HDW16]QIL20560.1 FAD-dependent oxidoreductase [Thermomonas sp. HDW16]